jgi:ribosomal protein L32
MCDDATCVNCGNDNGPHHLCTDCLALVGDPKDEE